MALTVNIHDLISSQLGTAAQFTEGRITSYSIFPAKEIDELPELIQQALAHAQEAEARPDPIQLYLQFPDLKDNPIGELITFHITRRDPGTFNQSESPGPPRIRRPIQVGVQEDAEHPGFQLLNTQRLMDNYIRLVCWSRDQKICLKRALWLEKIMWRYDWLFASYGFKNMRYEGWAEMAVSTSDHVTMFGQPLVYWLQTCQVDLVRTKTLDNLLVNIYLTTEEEEE